MSNEDHDSSPPKAEACEFDWSEGRTLPAEERILSLANVARMFGVSQVTLRYYELRGLIRRRHVVDDIRVYGWSDCERLAFIIKCRRAGLALREIGKVIEATDDRISVRGFLLGQERCMALVDRLERRRKIIDEALAELGHVHAILTARLMGRSRHRE